MKIDGQVPTTKAKKNKGCLSLKCSVYVSYIVSIVSNILLIIIQFISEHGYKWGGLILHGVTIAAALISIKDLIYFNSKNLIKYKTMSNYYAISIVLILVFYVIIVIYMVATDTDLDLIYYFIFCIIIWVIFHALFISIIRSFIKILEDRPAQKGNNVKMIDRNLRALMLNPQTEGV